MLCGPIALVLRARLQADAPTKRCQAPSEVRVQLEKACPGISPRTLSERLDMLERQGVLVRRSYPESPPHHRNALEPSRPRQSPRTVPGTVRSVQTL